MGNILKMAQKQTILGMSKLLGWSIHRISRETGHHRETIRKIIENSDQGQNVPEVPPGSVHFGVAKCPPAQSTKSQAFQFHEIIERKVEQNVPAKTIYHDLVYEHDFQGSYDCVKRYVRQLKPRCSKLTGVIFSPPGEEGQVDFGRGAPVIDMSSGRTRRPWLFKMVLSYSGHSYEEVVWNQKVETFIQCHINAFERFGGVPKVIRLDNLKSGVIQCCWQDWIDNPLYLSLSKHYGFISNPHPPGQPHLKGKIESGIGYTQNALKGKKFRSLEEQNQFLRWWNEHIARTRIHGSRKKQVWSMFINNEKEQLLPLPVDQFEYFNTGPRTVHVDSHIQVEHSFYSVPHQYLGKKVDVRWNSRWVRVYFKGLLIKTHRRTLEKGRYTTSGTDIPENYTMNQAQYREQLLVKGETIGPDVVRWINFMFGERKMLSYRPIQGVMSLKKKYSKEIMNEACMKAWKMKISRYRTVKELCAEISRNKQQMPLFSNDHEFIRPLSEYERYFGGL